MAHLYRNRAADEGAVRLWLALLGDVVRTAPREHLSVLSQDVRHAFRLFWRTPIVTATALLTIALGVGSTTAIFSVVYGVLLRPLPYPDPGRLVELFEDNRPANMPRFRVSTLNYLSWTERATGFEALGVFSSLQRHPDRSRRPGERARRRRDRLDVRGARPDSDRRPCPSARTTNASARRAWPCSANRSGGGASAAIARFSVSSSRSTANATR